MQLTKMGGLFRLMGVFATLSYVGNASALSLMEAYEAALANDSIYRAAMHDNEAGQQFKVLGRSNLLPNISANYSYNRVNSDISSSSNGVSRDETRNYNSENGAVQLRQPIFNL
jgi:protease secretion system outer membrane protein